MVGRSDADAETTEDDEEGGQPLPPLPCIRRVNITSDYESSNESPGSSDNNDVVLSDTDHLPKSLAVQTANQDVNRCTLCGGRTRHGVSIESTPRNQHFEDIPPSVQDDEVGYFKYSFKCNVKCLILMHFSIEGFFIKN